MVDDHGTILNGIRNLVVNFGTVPLWVEFSKNTPFPFQSFSLDKCPLDILQDRYLRCMQVVFVVVPGFRDLNIISQSWLTG